MTTSHGVQAAVLDANRLADRELEGRLGALVIDGASSFDLHRRAALARAWFENQNEALRAHVCGDPSLPPAAAPSDDEVLMSAVADLLLAAYDLPTAATLAVLIVRRGLHNLCV